MSNLREFFQQTFAHAAEIPYRAEEWFFTRPLQSLLMASPALIVAIALLGIISYQSFGAKSATVARYQQAFDEAFYRDDWETAGLFALKLAELQDMSDRGQFALARLAERRGHARLAWTLMGKLAPPDGEGHPPAHFWMAQRLLQEKQLWRGDESDALIHHLEQALRSSSSEHQEVAGTLLADIYIARGQYDEAVQRLQSLIGRRPDLQLKLAEVYLALEDEDQFQRSLEDAQQYFRDQLDTDPTDLDVRLQLARAQLLDGSLQEAESVLQAGLGETDEPRLHTALAEVYVAMSDQHKQEEPDALSTRLDLLQKALEHQPDHEQAMRQLADFLRLSEPQASTARAMLKDALANGHAAPTVHMILGTTAAADGEMDEARLHLEQAYALNPNLPDLLNNLAWVLARVEPPQLERALTLIDTALEQSPDHPEIRETRGQILARMERWKDALIDLEFALRALRGRPRLHATLAEIYQELGDKDMARLHRQRAEPLPGDEEAEGTEEGEEEDHGPGPER